ncbi:MAG: hypothetical protein GY694_04290 [Gammaproteobacteria bacterium]|nr:hypothetical protein [Gammaproteobacteria bacterium]
MKTLKILLTSALFASAAITGTVQAENPLSALTYEDSQNMFSSISYENSGQIGILSYGDDLNKDSVWSAEYEQYVNPVDFKQEIANIDDVNQYMGSNPTAAGRIKGREVFIYNENAGEYHLQ